MRAPVGLLLLAAGALAVAGATGGGPNGPRSQRLAARGSTAFALFSLPSYAWLDVNRVRCAVNDIGEQCVDPSTNLRVAGGFWPAGTADEYIRYGSLQLAAILSGPPWLPWAGDTVGAFLHYPSAAALTQVFDSRDEDDLTRWPSAAYVRDTALFDAMLIGRQAASEQDTWTRFWDLLDPGARDSRPHPMGLLVDQRTLAWNSPWDNADVVYVISRLINVTARDASRYEGLAAVGYTAEDIAELARLGGLFQDSVESKYGVELPDEGLAWTRLYVGMYQYPAVGHARRIYGTGILPFAMAAAYKSDFYEPTWQYPPHLFAPPFAQAPGFVGTKFLQAVGGPVTGSSAVSIFTNFTHNAPFGYRNSVAALWRMMSGNLISQDGTCTVPPLERHVCMVVSIPYNGDWHLASGPYPAVLGGGYVTFVFAYVFAPALGAFVTPSDVFNLVPGIPSTGPRLAAGVDTVRTVERAAGWVSHSDADLDGDVEQDEIRVAPGSLLRKAQMAQAFFEAGFLAPQAPAAPRFVLVPGEGQVTIVWEPSVSETVGDPYFSLAADPLSSLYDPNFRQFDVEGYRIWRGRTPSTMEVVAQFDYRGTSMTDHAGQFWTYDYGNRCAPELGIQTTCPADFLSGETYTVPMSGRVVQVPPLGRLVLPSGEVVVTRSDTAVTGEGTGFPNLADTGVPFVFVDQGLENSRAYYYVVTAFDVNSVLSGYTSLESERLVRVATPRITGGNRVAARVRVELLGGDGTPLGTAARYPSMDPATGTLSGPFPPTRGLAGDVAVFVEQQLASATWSLTVDSAIGEYLAYGGYSGVRLFLSSGAGPNTTATVLSGVCGWRLCPGVIEPLVERLAADTARARARGLEPVPFAGLATVRFVLVDPRYGSGAADSYSPYVYPSDDAGGSRWFSGANEQMEHPTVGTAHGQLQGGVTIFRPVGTRGAPSRFSRFDTTNRGVSRAADIAVYWGAVPGRPDSVVDLTHRVRVPFDPQYRASYGFLRDLAGADTSVLSRPDGILTSNDFLFGPCLAAVVGVPQTDCEDRDLADAAALLPVDVTGDRLADGAGIGLYINGEPFLFLTGALPSSRVWTYRSYSGIVRLADGTYSFEPQPSNPVVPGLTLRVTVEGPAGYADTAGDLRRVHTVPDPYYLSNAWEPETGGPVLRFVNLPDRAVIRIYTVGGLLVNVLTHNDPWGGGEEAWDLRNRSGWPVASGVYFFHVEAPDHRSHIGRFTIVRPGIITWPTP